MDLESGGEEKQWSENNWKKNNRELKINQSGYIIYGICDRFIGTQLLPFLFAEDDDSKKQTQSIVRRTIIHATWS